MSTHINPSTRLPDNYTVRVGDTITVKAGVRRHSKTGRKVKTEAHEVVITMHSNDHVVIVLDGVEYTFTIARFIHLAEGTLKNGAVLTRGPRHRKRGW